MILPATTRFRVTATGTLVSCNETWDLFALENDAPQLAGASGRGLNVFSMIGARRVHDFYRTVTSGILSGELPRLDMPTRFDSPEARRYGRFTARRLETIYADEVLFEATIDREEPRDPVVILYAAAAF